MMDLCHCGLPESDHRPHGAAPHSFVAQPYFPTTEESFLAKMAAEPENVVLRVAYSDFLAERAGVEKCKKCDGTAVNDMGVGYGSIPCAFCQQTGEVPNRAARLSEGYRALGEYGRVAWWSNPKREPDNGSTNFWYGRSSRLVGMIKPQESPYPTVDWSLACGLPDVWFDRVTGLYETLTTWKCGDTLVEAEDAAAEAWGRLTEEERERCHEELTARAETPAEVESRVLHGDGSNPTYGVMDHKGK